MIKPKRFRLLLFALILMGGSGVGFLVYNHGRPLQIPTDERLFSGVDYARKVEFSPRPMIIHTIIIDTRKNGIHFLVTPPNDPGTQDPLRARTTSQFLQEFGVQIAVNGDGFSPWWSNSPIDYYPHIGDPVHPAGYTASRGIVYWTSPASGPTLYISSHNRMSFDEPSKPYNAISGKDMLVMGGHQIPNLDNSALQPRTAIGYSKGGRLFYLVVVDGRQPYYSDGITLNELASVMVSLGVKYGMNLDGGGSSTMVIQGKNSGPRIMNSPIDNLIPGRERPVADHLGIYATK